MSEELFEQVPKTKLHEARAMLRSMQEKIDDRVALENCGRKRFHITDSDGRDGVELMDGQQILYGDEDQSALWKMKEWVESREGPAPLTPM